MLLAAGNALAAPGLKSSLEEIGNEVKRQALVMGFSDTFAVIGFVLALAGLAVLLTGKPKATSVGGGH